MNNGILSATEYHRTTSYRRYGLTPHTLDWEHQPVFTKNYPELPKVPLDRREELPAVDYFKLVRTGSNDGNRQSSPPNLQTISTVFRLTHDITARAVHMGQPFYYRSVASAGALYPFEIYLAAHHIDGLNPGLYHYHLFDSALTALRREAIPVVPPVASDVVATFYISAIFFRSAWKYRSRAYRYVLLDAGHLLENLRLAFDVLALSFSIHLDFDDKLVATLLGLDPEREACLVCGHLTGSFDGKKKTDDFIEVKPLSADILQASKVSEKEVAYPEILLAHQSGTAGMAASDNDRPAFVASRRHPSSWKEVAPPDQSSAADYVKVLWHRRSRRNFVPAHLSPDHLKEFLNLLVSTSGKASIMPRSYRTAFTTGLLVGDGASLSSGFYLLDPHGHRLGRVDGGRLTEPMAAACLDQMWLKNASLHVLFLTDLAVLDRLWGPRGYRYAMIEAGRIGQHVYLAATALGLGACGIGAIYDREAADLLELETDGALVYLVAAGPIKKR